MTRIDPPLTGDERSILIGFLEYHRTTLLWKCEGLTPAQLTQRAVPSSGLSLLGLLRHLAEVERGWFQLRVAGIVEPSLYCEQDNDGDFHVSADADAADVAAAIATFHAQVARSDEILAGIADLDQTFRHERTGEEMSIRWLLVHMVEEYARHNGHADLLREAIDGVTGE
jgi:uncharacterized damage-inducible protein DinB